MLRNRFHEYDGGGQCTFASLDSHAGCVLVVCTRSKYEEVASERTDVCGYASSGDGNCGTETVVGNGGNGEVVGDEEGEVF